MFITVHRPSAKWELCEDELLTTDDMDLVGEVVGAIG
jgi:hypothetical protein